MTLRSYIAVPGLVVVCGHSVNLEHYKSQSSAFAQIANQLALAARAM